jgi:radical SAM superfamily enzyme YgiQ (UPF0313 family)
MNSDGPIVLATLNSKYIHASFGLRYLKANLGDLESRAEILEFTIQNRAIDVVEAILSKKPAIIGFGIYIWNVRQTTDVIAILKRLAPQILIVIGGPEVSHEWQEQEIVRLADVLVTGEGEELFPQICRQFLETGEKPNHVWHSQPLDVDKLEFPYRLYTDEDLKNRVLYVEASRGCPFKCEFCLSSLDKSVRAFETDAFLEEMKSLILRGARQFKFVDRTFNLKIETSLRILQFFADHYCEGMFVHFEMVPDRLPDELRQVIAAFPKGALQFEVGIQTFNTDVAKLISRRQNYEKLEDNLRFLAETGVHVHADLIAGLPGESLESFGKGFNRLFGLGTQEIQVGILKRLRGTPISRHTQEYQMLYDPNSPYEVLSTGDLCFDEVQGMKRFARYWDLVGNSGHFHHTLPLILQDSPFENFWAFSVWLYQRTGQTHAIALKRLYELVFEFLSEGRDELNDVGLAVLRDWRGGGRRDQIYVLKPWESEVPILEKSNSSLPERQARHA